MAIIKVRKPDRTERLQPVSKVWAGSRGLGREREGIDRSSKRPSRLLKSRFRVRRRPVSRFSQFRFRFPCATATNLANFLLPGYFRRARLQPAGVLGASTCSGHNDQQRSRVGALRGVRVFGVSSRVRDLPALLDECRALVAPGAGRAAEALERLAQSLAAQLQETEALRRENERLGVAADQDRGLLEAVLEHSPHGIIVSDARGKLFLQNRASERIWAGSATAADVEGWGQYRAFHPDGRPFQPEDWSMSRCLSRGETVEAEEVHFQRFDGTHGILLGSCAPMRAADGTLTGALSVFADVTRFKEMEAALRTSEKTAAERAAKLQEFSALLSAAVTPEQVGAVVQDKGIPLSEAQAGRIFLADSRQLRLLVPPQRRQQVIPFRTLPLGGSNPVCDAFGSGEPKWLRSPDELRAAYRELGSVLAMGECAALAALPLSASGTPVGAMLFSFSERREFAEREQQ